LIIKNNDTTTRYKKHRAFGAKFKRPSLFISFRNKSKRIVFLSPTPHILTVVFRGKKNTNESKIYPNNRNESKLLLYLPLFD